MNRKPLALRSALAGLLAALTLLSPSALASPRAMDEEPSFIEQTLSVGWRVAVVWAFAFLTLLVLGRMLSHAALRAADVAPEGVDGHPRGAEKTVRRLYRAVLWLCCAFYYLSLPLLLVVVVLAGGGLIYGFFALGQIRIKLVLLVAIVTLTTVGAVLKSVFVRAREVDPGLRLDLEEHPRLQAALAEVAAKIGTSEVDTVFITPGTEMAVIPRPRREKKTPEPADDEAPAAE